MIKLLIFGFLNTIVGESQVIKQNLNSWLVLKFYVIIEQQNKTHYSYNYNIIINKVPFFQFFCFLRASNRGWVKYFLTYHFMCVAIKVFAVGICFVFERIIWKIFRYYKQEKNLNVKVMHILLKTKKSHLKLLYNSLLILT
jgi:hypothetical protein